MTLDEMKETLVEKFPSRKHPEWEKDYFADTTAGKIALERMTALCMKGSLGPHFRLYEMGWLENGGPIESWDTMEVKGCEFRKAKTGPRRGFYVIPVAGTHRTVHVTKDQMRDYESQQRKLKAMAEKKLPPKRQTRAKPVEVDPETVVSEEAVQSAKRMDRAFTELRTLFALWLNPESDRAEDTLTESEIQCVLAYSMTNRMLYGMGDDTVTMLTRLLGEITRKAVDRELP